MFGYILVNEQELKIKEFVRYRSYYCGLCEALRDTAGVKGGMTLSYDLTFLVILLSALYEPETDYHEKRCVVHPLMKHPMRRNEVSDYVADMNLLLSYFKGRDDWADERKLAGKATGTLLKKKVKEIRNRYPEKTALIAKRMRSIGECEKRQEKNPDIPAGLFGDILGTIFAWKDDIWKEDLYELGFYLGKYIYLLDAWDDREKDSKSGNYNIFLLREDLDSKELLTMMMAGCAKAFERLPIVDVDEANILRNIIYTGVWNKYGDGSVRSTGNKTRCIGRRN